MCRVVSTPTTGSGRAVSFPQLGLGESPEKQLGTARSLGPVGETPTAFEICSISTYILFCISAFGPFSHFRRGLAPVIAPIYSPTLIYVYLVKIVVC